MNCRIAEACGRTVYPADGFCGVCRQPARWTRPVDECAHRMCVRTIDRMCTAARKLIDVRPYVLAVHVAIVSPYSMT